MKVLLVVVLVFAAFLQADARSIGINEELPKVLRETMEQSFSCGMQMGATAGKLPAIQGLEQFPEDNAALNQLWGCIFEKKGILNHENIIDDESLYTYLMAMFTIFVPANDELRAMADDITTTCKDVEADEYQLKAVRLQNCINYNVKKRAGL